MGSPSRIESIVDSIRNLVLLNADDLKILEQRVRDGRYGDEEIIRDLVQRDKLSKYQARKLWKNEATDLMIGPYLLVSKLGEGGMGEVFKAFQRNFGRDVALKVIRRDRVLVPEVIERFRREMTAAASLNHENVVTVYDAGQIGEIHYFAMEYVHGTNLSLLVRQRGKLPFEESCDYICQTAAGLQHAHEKGFIHRDIKPANLLLSDPGIVKISDLGLVRAFDPDGTNSGSRLTKEGLVVGTPDFVAPEQAKDARKADIRCDVYSLGCTFFHLLNGGVPYPGGTPTEKILRHSREPIPEILRDDIPPVVRKILRKMMAKKPDDRYQTPQEVADELKPFRVEKKKTLTVVPAMPIVELADEIDLLFTAFKKDQKPDTDSRFRLPPDVIAPPSVLKSTKRNTYVIVIAMGLISITIAAFLIATKLK